MIRAALVGTDDPVAHGHGADPVSCRHEHCSRRSLLELVESRSQSSGGSGSQQHIAISVDTCRMTGRGKAQSRRACKRPHLGRDLLSWPCPDWPATVDLDLPGAPERRCVPALDSFARRCRRRHARGRDRRLDCARRGVIRDESRPRTTATLPAVACAAAAPGCREEEVRRRATTRNAIAALDDARRRAPTSGARAA